MMDDVPLPLDSALADLRPLLLDPDRLVRAVAAGRRRTELPSVARAELRPVDLKSGRVLQVVTHDGRQATTRNTPYGAAAGTVDALLAEPFGNWHVETLDETVQLRVTKKGAAIVPGSKVRPGRASSVAREPLRATMSGRTSTPTVRTPSTPRRSPRNRCAANVR
jgi:hypothetical protein